MYLLGLLGPKQSRKGQKVVAQVFVIVLEFCPNALRSIHGILGLPLSSLVAFDSTLKRILCVAFRARNWHTGERKARISFLWKWWL